MERDESVTYIGPRAFVAVFALLCVVFGATLFAAPYFIETLEPAVSGAHADPPATTAIAPPVAPAIAAAPAAIATRPNAASSLSRVGRRLAPPTAAPSRVAGPPAPFTAVPHGLLSFETRANRNRTAIVRRAPVQASRAAVRASPAPVTVRAASAQGRERGATDVTPLLVPFDSAAASPSTSALAPRAAARVPLLVVPAAKL